ncbi:glycosyltransferase family 4 protein [Thalassospira marina]|nr:glycosyltransferase family 4 protein [Thalassospira marina]
MNPDIWMIGRVDQFALLAAHLARQGRLARWDSFWRHCTPDAQAPAPATTTHRNLQSLFARPARRVDPVLTGIKGRHLTPDILGKSPRMLRLPAHNLASDLPLSWLAARNMPHNVRILHGQGNYSLPAMKRARKHHIITISDVTGQLAPIRAMQLGAEYQQYGQKWREISAFLAKRRIKEACFADAVFAPSATVANGLITCGVAEERIHIIPFDAPLARQCLLLDRPISTLPSPSCPLHLLFIGEISLAKGIAVLLRAFQMLRSRYNATVTLTLIGRERQCAADLMAGLPDGVNWQGAIPARDVPSALQKADIFVFPSLSEGSSLAVQEAMAASLPVITSFDAGSPIEDGKNGIIIPPRNADALANAILRLVHDATLRQTLGTNARNTIARQLAEGYGNRVCNAYDEVLTRHG